MKLYHSPGACSLAPHIVAREAGLPLTLVNVDIIGDHKLKDGTDYYGINARGYVPMLELDDGSRHTEASALIQYLSDLAPKTGLMPAAGSMERFKVQQWIGFVATELHKGFSPYLWRQDTPEETKKIAIAGLHKRFAELDKALAGKSYLTGETFTAADAYAFTTVNWVNFLGIDISAYKNLSAFMARVAARPKVQEALKAEGLVQ